MRLTKHKRAMRNGDVNNHIAEHHSQMNIKSIGTLQHEITPLNYSRQLPALYQHCTNDLLMESSKTNYERTTG